jgi:hypothetical protein
MEKTMSEDEHCVGFIEGNLGHHLKEFIIALSLALNLGPFLSIAMQTDRFSQCLLGLERLAPEYFNILENE